MVRTDIEALVNITVVRVLYVGTCVIKKYIAWNEEREEQEVWYEVNENTFICNTFDEALELANTILDREELEYE